MENLSPAAIAPISQKERILLIDSLRGIALLGILLMNMPAFALPGPAIGNPALYGDPGTINYAVFYFIDWFMEGSQRALFSMLFGAGMLVFTSRLESRLGDGMLTAEMYLRRQLWLLLFGLFNAFILLWHWDILFPYAIAGFILLAFRRLKPTHLIVAASLCLILQTARDNRNHYLERKVIVEGEAVAAIDTALVKLSDDQKASLAALNERKNNSTTESKLKRAGKETKAMLGSWGDVYELRSDRSMRIETTFFYFTVWDILLFMFVGLAFFKWGILQGSHPVKTYLWMTVLGLGIGLPLSYLRLEPLVRYNFNDFEFVRNVSFTYYEISRTIRALGIFGLIMLAYKSGWFSNLFRLMQPVGQMAFTNYLMQSLICAILFYGFGFGLFGKLQRVEIYYVVFAIWAFQIGYSNIWLRYFRFGPMEWLWRTLTYWQLQPLRKQSGSATNINKPEQETVPA